MLTYHLKAIAIVDFFLTTYFLQILPKNFICQIDNLTERFEEIFLKLNTVYLLAPTLPTGRQVAVEIFLLASFAREQKIGTESGKMVG
ncbi:hypothetical protein M0M57_06245 [Flavobacterium azooxidireducens]|uniref:Uncharacterized protein n=1 Tax=Flavobacterium azooxidireducens TaxID=1871076 RepID=A0ABY4KIE0_9FLAO|nr:hypothetical protein [Flavobacterium azooxidireducens]UPQ80434.1 hypothetical protein M0M57_06245 [Flavobacterium azooxidireducens]